MQFASPQWTVALPPEANSWPVAAAVQGIATWLVLICLCAGLIGCGLFAPRTAPLPAPLPAPMPVPAAPAPIDELARLRTRLYQQFNLWRGVRYELGGFSTRGIDCSGFVLITFKTALGIDLPRTTAAQAESGRGISRLDLQSGDLVFFKTGATERHVGIYLERGRFMHASKRRGVMISDLGKEYWRRRFWQARRIRG